MGVNREEAIVVPAYPYEGALFLLLDTQSAKRGDHSYYKALYGQEARTRTGIASSLAALFDRIAVAGADVAFPEGGGRGGFGPDDNYEHAGLGVTLHQPFGEWRDESRGLVPALLANEQIVRLSHRMGIHARWDQEFFLKRMVSQILLANECGGVLLGNHVFRRYYNIVAPILVRELGVREGDNPAWSIDHEDIDFLALQYTISSLDDFAFVRESKDVRSYAKHVRRVLAEAAEAEDTKTRLRELAIAALDSQELSKKVARTSGDLGTLGTLAGLVPVVGTIASVVSIASDATTRANEAIHKRADWTHISSRMKDAIVDGRIRADHKTE